MAAVGVQRAVLRRGWRVDDTSVKLGGRWQDLYWAIDAHGQIVDVDLSARRNAEAARTFFEQASNAREVRQPA